MSFVQLKQNGNSHQENLVNGIKECKDSGASPQGTGNEGALTESCFKSEVSLKRGLFIFSYRKELQRACFCFGFPLGNIKGENKGNSEPLSLFFFFFATGHSVDNLSSEVPVKCWSAPLHAQCRRDVAGSPDAVSSARTQRKEISSQSQKETFLSKGKKCVRGPMARAESNSRIRFLGRILVLTLLSSAILASYLTSMCPCHLTYKDKNNNYCVGLP